MAENSTRIILTAEDKTGPALASVTGGLRGVEQSAGLAGRALQMLGAIGVTAMAASLVAFVKGTIDAADGMNDLAQKVGIGIKQLAGWKLAAEQSGTSMESVAKGVKALSSYVLDNGEKLRAAGVTATDASGAMMQLADIFAYMPDGIEKTALAVQIFGKSGMDMIPMLNMGSKGLGEAQDKAKRYAEELERLAPDADKFNDTLRELKLQSEAAALSMVSKVIGPMQQMAEALKDARDGAEGAQRALLKLQELTNSGPLSIFGLGAAVAGARIPRSIGYTGERNALGLPATDDEIFARAMGDFVGGGGIEDAYKRQAARKRAAGLLDKQKPAAGVDSALERMLKRGQDNLAASMDSEEEARILAEKRAMTEAKAEFEALQRMIHKGEENELALYYETAGEETMRLVAAQRALKQEFDDMTEFARQAARNMQDAFADFFFDALQGKFDNLGDRFKLTIDRMVANAAAANLGNYLLGDFGKTGNLGGVVGDFARGFMAPAGFGDAAGAAAGVPQYAIGTDYVPRTGLALLHQGEAVVPANKNAGRVSVQNTFVLQAPADRRTQEQIAALSGAAIQRAMSRNG